MKTKLYEEKTARMKYLDILAMRKGFKSHTDYLDHKAVEKGFKSQSDRSRQWLVSKGKTVTEYQKELIKRRGYESYADYRDKLYMLKLGTSESLDNPSIACETLSKLMLKHPKMIEEVFDTDVKKIVVSKIRNMCKSKLLSEMLY